MDEMWFVLGINPEPWAVGPLSVIRRAGKLIPSMGRNQQLDAYQEAIRDELTSCYTIPTADGPLSPGYELDFFFWRNRADYAGARKDVRKNQVDATNMQKATEDALQGLLIENDRDVRRISSTIVAQGPDVTGAVAFRLRWGVPEIKEQPLIPVHVLLEVASVQTVSTVSDNSWPPR